MRTLRMFQSLIVCGVLLSSVACTKGSRETAELKLQFHGPIAIAAPVKRSRHPKARTMAPSVAQMDCLLLNVSGEGMPETFGGKTFRGEISAACLKLGTVSKAVSLSTATSTGINLRVKPGPARKIEVLGYYGGLGASCADKSFEQLMEQSGGTPEIYLLGSENLNVTGDATFTVSNTYDSANSADRIAACASSTAVTGANLFSWDGSIYTDLGLDAESVDALYFDSGTNSLYVGGDFQNAGGNTSADYIAMYDATNSAWSAVGSPSVNGRVRAITMDSGGNIYFGGDFTDAGGNAQADGFARFVGGSLEGLPGAAGGSVYALSYVGSNVYVGGEFTSFGSNVQAIGLAEFRPGSPNQFLAPGAPTIGASAEVYALNFSGGYLYLGGSYTAAGGNSGADYVAKFATGAFSPIHTGLNGPIYALNQFSSQLYAGGDFVNTNADPYKDYIALFTGSYWASVAFGMDGKVLAMATLGSCMYAGGSFTSASSVADTKHIACFDGADWYPAGNGLNGEVTALVEGLSRIYIGGNFTAEN